MDLLPFDDPPPRKPFDPTKVSAPNFASMPDQPAGPITVSQLTSLVKRALQENVPATVQVVGELSNVKRHGSGHLYFTLKDRFSEIAGVMWRSDAAKLKFDLRDGMEVIATGALEVFEKAGRYQLYVRTIAPRGGGALDQAFRQLRERLQQEGLFEIGRKKALPPFPHRIALVTSATGAAVVDIIKTIERRFPCVQLLLYSVRVSGPGAAQQISTAIRELNANQAHLGGIDLLIVGRGGGSLEDLWAFNEEIVARAIFASSIPVISAVGHESDVTIADLVADVRAATPTAAAELAVPVLSEVQSEISQFAGRISRCFQQRLEVAMLKLDALLRRRVFAEPVASIHGREEQLDQFASAMSVATNEQVQANLRRLRQLEQAITPGAAHQYIQRWAIRFVRSQHLLQEAWIRRITQEKATLQGMRLQLRRTLSTERLAIRNDGLRRLQSSLTSAIQRSRSTSLNRLDAAQKLLEAISYKSVLARGFSITRAKKSGDVVRSQNDITSGDAISTELVDGKIESTVVKTTD